MDKVFDQWFSDFFKQLDLCGINTKHFFKGVLCLISRKKKIQYIQLACHFTETITSKKLLLAFTGKESVHFSLSITTSKPPKNFFV